MLLLPPTFFQGPGGFPLGTDHLGRDVWSRLLWGSRFSLSVGLLSVALGSSLGALVGLTSGFLGGKYDLLLQRCIDALQVFPGLLLALAIVATLGPSVHHVVLAIALGFVATQARVMRAAALAAREHPYIEAARALGCPESRVLFRHVLPNCLRPYIVLASAELGNAVLLEASLSFLGLSTPPPHPSWGAMLSGAQQYLQQAPWLALFPGLAISLTVLGCNLLGDALGDALDPRRRGRSANRRRGRERKE
jgi:peptide/nickel transport system permease protein